MAQDDSSRLNRRSFLKLSAAAAGAAALPLSGALGTPATADASERAARHAALYDQQRAFAEWRFGMFIHYNMSTYHDVEWCPPNQDPLSFKPTRLDCGQWADAAKSAGMSYAVLTTKHHDGFCLWPSAYTKYTVMSSSYRQDIVRQYVDAFRSRGVTPCFYFSIWDRTQGVASGSISRADIDYVKGQLTELLTNYGSIPVLVIDGWAWQMGHKQMPYGEIRKHIKSLQPNILLIDHNGQNDPWDEDAVYFEQPKGIWCPPGNTYASCQGQNFVQVGWFWHPESPSTQPLSVSKVVNDHIKVLEARYCSFLLNCAPNPEGRFDSNVVTRLAEIGRAWSPNTARPPLPAQPDTLLYPITPVAASATSGTAANAIDGLIDWAHGAATQTLWQSSGALPQSVTADLGAVYSTIDMLTYLPRQDKDSGGRVITTGNVTAYNIYVSTNGSSFTRVASGAWAADSRMKRVRFTPTSARYVRFEATAANGASYAVVSELSFGGFANEPSTGAPVTATPVTATPVTATPVTATPATPTPDGGIVAGATYKLVARHSGKVLDVNGSSTADGASVQQWADTGGANQQWQFAAADGGYYKVVARHSGKVLDVTGRSTADGALVVQWADTGATNQQWQVVALGGGYYKVVARHSGKALDVTARSTADGALIEQWADNGGTNQQWQLVRIS